MKKISIILLSALMCLILMAPCFATVTGSVVDMADIISEQDEDSLSRYINDIASRTGVNIYIVTEARDNEDDGASGVAYDFEANLTGSYIILADEETSNKAMILASQDLVDDIGYEDDDAIINATLENWYYPEDTYNCCMIFLSMTDNVLSAHYGTSDTTSVTTDVVESAATDVAVDTETEPAPYDIGGDYHVYDVASVLDSTQLQTLEEKAQKLSDATGTFVIIWIENIGTDDIDIVHNYCLSIEATMSPSDKTLICTLDPNERFVNVYASDESPFTVADNDYMYDHVRDAMAGNDNWYGGAIAFINAANALYKNDFSVPKEPFTWFKHIAIALVIGLIIALIVVFILKGQLKSVVHKTGAREYVKEGTFNLTSQRDIFLYNTVTRTEIPKNNSSASHSSGGGGHSSGGHV